MKLKAWLIIAAALLVGLAAGHIGFRDGDTIMIEVGGRYVARPGLYTVPPGTHVWEAIRRAGGLIRPRTGYNLATGYYDHYAYVTLKREGKDMNVYSLAEPLQDGDYLQVDWHYFGRRRPYTIDLVRSPFGPGGIRQWYHAASRWFSKRIPKVGGRTTSD